MITSEIVALDHPSLKNAAVVSRGHIWVNIKLFSKAALLCAMVDGTTMLKVDKIKNKAFVDVDWVEKYAKELMSYDNKKYRDEGGKYLAVINRLKAAAEPFLKQTQSVSS